MIATQDIDRIIGAEAVGPDNDKIGKVGQIYVDQNDEQPVWVSVKSGIFGTSETLVPLQGAEWDTSALHLAFSKDRVKDAPRVEPDGELSPQEQERLYAYYGMRGADAAGPGRSTGEDTRGDRAGLGRDTDEAMTRSEERLRVGTERVETGRARLRKYVVTDQQTVSVPVSHEEVRVEREPITGAGRGAGSDRPVLSDEEREVVLTEERPVIDKETVPVERVRLGTETVADERQVTEDVRREEVDTEGTDRRGLR